MDTTAKKGLMGVKLTNAFGVDPDDLIIVGGDTPDKKSPLYDERVNLPVNESLVKNIMVYGVLEPVLVRKNSHEDFEVVDGRQRVRAAREANNRLREAGRDAEVIRVPILVKKAEGGVLAGMMVSANEIRQDDTPLAKARKAGHLIGLGRTEDEVATIFGVTTQTIGNWLRLLNLAPELLTQVEQGNVSASEASKVAKAPEAVQRKIAAKVEAEPAKRGRPSGEGGVSLVPSKKRIRTMIETPEVKSSRAAVAALNWVLGLLDDEGLDRALRESKA
jgi:ParB family chromosome partitioning protein